MFRKRFKKSMLKKRLKKKSSIFEIVGNSDRGMEKT